MATREGRFEHALVVGKFAPLHAGHQFLIETALRESCALSVLGYSNPDFPGMPQTMRAGWIRALYPGLDVRVPDTCPPDDCSDHVHRMFVKDYLLREGLRVDVVFSSESYGPGFALVIGAAHQMVDHTRKFVPVSGTAIRADPAAYSAYLPPIVREHLATGVDTSRGVA
jgi:nicotinamide mononucleotide adenylyltransferase